MALTYEKITSTTLGSDTTTVTFDNIPSSYTDIVLRASVRDTAAGTNNGSMKVQIAGDTGSNYSFTLIDGNGTAASSTLSNGNTNWNSLAGNGASTGNTSNTFSSVELYIPSYAGSNKKVAFSFGVGENNATAANIDLIAHLNQNTTAINSLSITSGIKLATGSSFYLYGIKAA